jgi:hypothetical protein
MIDASTYLKLQTALIKYDARQRRGKRYNPYAIAHYMKALASVREACDSGSTLAQALYDNFNDRLLTCVERASGLPVTFGGGSHDVGRPTY